MDQTDCKSKECPIGIDCISLINFNSVSACPNRDYCKNLSNPWKLPYIYGIGEDNTKVLKVQLTFGHLSLSHGRQMREELALTGFASAWKLPFKILQTENRDKALVVLNPCPEAEQAGWLEAEELPQHYYWWCAAKTSSNFVEYDRFNHGNPYSNHWLYHEQDYYPQTLWLWQHDQTEPTPF